VAVDFSIIQRFIPRWEKAGGQVSWLCGHCPGRSLPSIYTSGKLPAAWTYALQWRDRSGLAPDSLFSLDGHPPAAQYLFF